MEALSRRIQPRENKSGLFLEGLQLEPWMALLVVISFQLFLFVQEYSSGKPRDNLKPRSHLLATEVTGPRAPLALRVPHGTP